MVQSREQSWAPGEGMGGGQPSGCHSPCCPPTFPEHRRVTSRHPWSVSHYYGSHAWPRYAHCVRGWGRPKETQPKHGVSEDGIVRVTVSMGLCAGPTLGQTSLRACVREPAPFGAHPLPWGPGDKGRGGRDSPCACPAATSLPSPWTRLSWLRLAPLGYGTSQPPRVREPVHPSKRASPPPCTARPAPP